jgi:hypothetical protein
MRQAASVQDVVVHMLLPSISTNTRPTRFAPIDQEHMVRFNGTSWERFGDVRALVNSTSRLESRFGPGPRTNGGRPHR